MEIQAENRPDRVTWREDTRARLMSRPISINLSALQTWMCVCTSNTGKSVCAETSRDGDDDDGNGCAGSPFLVSGRNSLDDHCVRMCCTRQDWIGARLSVVVMVKCTRGSTPSCHLPSLRPFIVASLARSRLVLILTLKSAHGCVSVMLAPTL